MLKTETITINGKTFTRTWSDSGYMVERDGALYEEAIDPAELGRTYTETDQPIEDTEATEADYLAALDKQEIATQAAGLVEVPDSGGNVDLTGYATEQYVQEYAQPKGEYLTEVPEDYAKTEDIPTKPEDIGAQPADLWWPKNL